MSAFIGVPFWMSLPAGVGDPAAQRAMSQFEMYQRGLAMLPLLQQASPNPYGALAAMNYRPPVFVPQGWQDWYATGDQLH